MPQQPIPFWNAFKRWWWLIAISAGLAGFSAYTFSSRQPAIYQSTVTLRVGAGISAPSRSELEFGATLAGYYEKLVRLPPITRAVIEELDLPMSPGELAEQIDTNTIGQAQILQITVFAASPQVAADLANAVGHELINQTTPAADKALDPDFLQGELAKTRAQVDEIDAQIRQLRDQMLTLTSAADVAEAQNRLEGLVRTGQELRNYYIQTAELITSRSTTTLTVIVPATPNPSPLGPNPLRDAILGVVGGILLAVGAIALLEFSDNALRWGDVTLENSLPVLGIVPTMPRKRNHLILTAQPHSVEADALRSLRTRIFLAGSGALIKRLLITSPTPLDGKSFTSVNLALAAADAGLRVIIVDGDIRAGTVHEYFGLEHEPGLTDLLWNRSMDQAQSLGLLRRTSISNLQVLTAGTYARDPLMLLRSPRLQHLMDDLSEGADLIIIDSPPVTAGPITAVLSTAADGIVMVARVDRTNRKLFNLARDELLKNAKAPLLGLALNRVALGKLSLELGMVGYGYNYSRAHPPNTNTKVRGVRSRDFLGRLRSLPAIVVGKVTRRRVMSRNGEQPSTHMARWLEETPSNGTAGDLVSPSAPAAVAADRPAVKANSDSDMMTVAEAALQLEVPEETIEE